MSKWWQNKAEKRSFFPPPLVSLGNVLVLIVAWYGQGVEKLKVTLFA